MVAKPMVDIEASRFLEAIISLAPVETGASAFIRKNDVYGEFLHYVGNRPIWKNELRQYKLSLGNCYFLIGNLYDDSLVIARFAFNLNSVFIGKMLLSDGAYSAALSDIESVMPFPKIESRILRNGKEVYYSNYLFNHHL